MRLRAPRSPTGDRRERARHDAGARHAAAARPLAPGAARARRSRCTAPTGRTRAGRSCTSDDTDYARGDRPPTAVEEAARRARGRPPDLVQGPMMKPPVWTWEIPLYFWLGGIAAGSSFVALACDLAGDHRSARVARLVALGALAALARRC